MIPHEVTAVTFATRQLHTILLTCNVDYVNKLLEAYVLAECTDHLR